MTIALAAIALGAGAGATSAAFSDTASNPVSTFSAGTWATPTAAVVAPAAGCSTGRVKQNAGYYVYAIVAGSPSTVEADVSALSNKAGPSAMSPGSWTIGGTTYNYRSALENADKALVEGPVSVTVDAGGTPMVASVTIDNTKATAVDIQTGNGNGTAGIADAGDTITYTFSEPMDPCTIIPGWTGSSSQNVVVRITDRGGSKDELSVWDAAGTTQLPLGDVNLGPARGDYTAGAQGATFGAVANPSKLRRLTATTYEVTLGALSGGSVRSAGGADTMVWTPKKEANDLAGNDTASTTATESGASDREF